ncbi:MAG TPA: hypothetical protein VGR64_04995 [Terracidiphilus sp.]|nr:hypothetical protein [Terracidiphilus sp.]
MAIAKKSLLGKSSSKSIQPTVSAASKSTKAPATTKLNSARMTAMRVVAAKATLKVGRTAI